MRQMTEQNMINAFCGESMAHMRYLLFAQQGRIAAESSRPRGYSLKRVALGPSISISMRAFSTAFPLGSLLK